MASTDIKLTFPDDRTQEDFEVAFRGWLKQYQQQAGLARAVGGAKGGSSGSSGTTGGLTSGGGGHSYGSGGGQQGSTGGLLSLGGGKGPYGIEVEDFYLNFIGGC
jgi:hypothetical protein